MQDSGGLSVKCLAVIRHPGRGGVVRLTPIGEIDLLNAGCLYDAIAAALSEPQATELVVDLALVDFLSCAGVSALVDGRRAATSGTKSFAVVNAYGITHKVLFLTGLLDQLAYRAPRRPTLSVVEQSAPGHPQVPGIGNATRHRCPSGLCHRVASSEPGGRTPAVATRLDHRNRGPG